MEADAGKWRFRHRYQRCLVAALAFLMLGQSYATHLSSIIAAKSQGQVAARAPLIIFMLLASHVVLARCSADMWWLPFPQHGTVEGGAMLTVSGSSFQIGGRYVLRFYSSSGISDAEPVVATAEHATLKIRHKWHTRRHRP